MDKIKEQSFGFTLIELIIVISIMGILGLIFTDTIINTLRGESKVRATNQIKQNGQVILDKLSNEIRQADRVVCIGKAGGGTLDDTIVISKGGAYYRYRLHGPGTGNGYISVESFNLTTYSIDITASISTTEYNYCTDSASTDGMPLSDQDLVTGVSIDFDVDNAGTAYPLFSYGANSDYKDMVTIRFRAFQSVRAGSNYENQIQVPFTTTVQVRG